MNYLIEKDLKKVETCYGYWLISGEDCKEWISEKDGPINSEDVYRLYEYKIRDDLYANLKENIPNGFGVLNYSIVLDDDIDNNKYKLYHTIYNTSSVFSLFLCNLEYISIDEEED